jgi:hypothetical protein
VAEKLRQHRLHLWHQANYFEPIPGQAPKLFGGTHLDPTPEAP